MANWKPVANINYSVVVVVFLLSPFEGQMAVKNLEKGRHAQKGRDDAAVERERRFPFHADEQQQQSCYDVITERIT